MKFEVFSIFDSAAAAFLPPWTVPTQAMALRHLGDLPASQPAHEFCKHPEQYTLFRLATFDSSSGAFESVSQEAVSNLRVLFDRVKVASDRERSALHLIEKGESDVA